MSPLDFSIRFYQRSGLHFSASEIHFRIEITNKIFNVFHQRKDAQKHMAITDLPILNLKINEEPHWTFVKKVNCVFFTILYSCVLSCLTVKLRIRDHSFCPINLCSPCTYESHYILFNPKMKIRTLPNHLNIYIFVVTLQKIIYLSCFFPLYAIALQKFTYS